MLSSIWSWKEFALELEIYRQLTTIPPIHLCMILYDRFVLAIMIIVIFL